MVVPSLVVMVVLMVAAGTGTRLCRDGGGMQQGDPALIVTAARIPIPYARNRRWDLLDRKTDSLWERDDFNLYLEGGFHMQKRLLLRGERPRHGSSTAESAGPSRRCAFTIRASGCYRDVNFRWEIPS